MKRTTLTSPPYWRQGSRISVKNGWTQTELAARMQVVGYLSREIIARIESGFRQTSVFEIDI